MFGILWSMNAVRATELEGRIGLLAARIHAAMYELAVLAAEYDASGQWAGVGVRSCAHWLSITIGVDLRTGTELVRVGHAVETLPALAAEFAAGRLSFDKMRAVTRVATPEDEAMWLNIALSASGGQLARICRAVRRSLDVDDPRRADDAEAHRGVRIWWRDDGMLELMAVLPREDGALVLAALEAAASDVMRERATAAPDD